MVDVAKLGIEVDSRSVASGERALDSFTASGARADRSARDVGEGAKQGGRGLSLLTKAAVGFTSVVSVGLFAQNSIRSARPFNAALSETSTLIEGTAAEMAFLEGASRDLAKQFGGDATQQVNAFYQAISAGAGSVENAATLLDSANKLAVGGVTDVTTSVDALTTATNAYAAQGLTAAQASDALFVAIKGGKTTAAELGASIGNIVPIAAAAGISFDEMLAGVAALTTQGQSTSVAVTGLRQVIAGVLKPTSEATKLADKLGLSFDVQALKSQGLAGFLQQVIEKTGGSQESMAQLFGSVEALNAVLAFAGGGGEAFAGILGDMAEKTGAADAAFEKMAASLDGRANVALASLSDSVLGLGNTLLPAYVNALELAAGAVDFMAANSDILGTAIVALTATQIPALIATTASAVTALTAGATATGVLTSALGALRVAIAVVGGPWGLLASAIAAAASYFLVFRDNSEKAKTAASNATTATEALNKALGVFNETKAPSAGKAAIDLANDNVKLAQSAVQAAEAELAKIRAVEASNNLNRTGFSKFAADNEAALIAEDKAYIEGVLSDAELFLKSAKSGLLRAANAVTGATYESSEVVIPKVPTLSLGDAAKEASKSFEDLFNDRKVQLEQERELIGKSVSETARLRAESELRGEVNRLVSQRGQALTVEEIILTENLIATYGDEAAAVALVGEQHSLAAQKVADHEREQEQLKQSADQANTTLFQGMTRTALQADSVTDAIKRIGLQLAELALSDFASGLFGGNGSGALGGIFSSLGGGLASSFTGGSSSGVANGSAVPSFAQFANGGAFTNGIVSKPTSFAMRGGTGLMGEAGPEAIMPLARASNGQLGVQMQGGGGQQSVHVTVSAGPEFDVRVEQSAAPVAERAVAASNAQRDRSFTPRMMAAQGEMEKDYR